MKTRIHKTIGLLSSLVFILSVGTLFAEKRPDHFKGEPAPTLEIALYHLAVYNQQLAQIIEKGDFTAADFHKIHRLSYTLENALETLAREQARMAELLEEVHLASELHQSARIKKNGRAYLQATAPLIRHIPVNQSGEATSLEPPIE